MTIIQNLFLNPFVKLVWYKLCMLSSNTPKILPTSREPDYLILGKSQVDSRDKPFPQIIWSYWSGKKSPCAEACERSWKEYSSSFTIRVLTPNTIKEVLPDFPCLPDDIPEQKVSNLVRLMLMEQYGGIWMDYSIVLTESLDWVVTLLKDNNCEALAFYNEHPDEYLKNHNRPIIENGFIAAFAESKFICKWRAIYQECIQCNDYRNFFFNQENFTELTSNFVNKDRIYIEYFVCYIAAQHVMLNSADYRLLLINAEQEYYFTYYAVSPPRNKRKFAEEILLKNYHDRRLPRLIKIPGGHRSRIDEYIRYSCFRKSSILGRYL